MSKALIDLAPVSTVNTPSPLVALDVAVARQYGINLYLKRDDLLNPHFGGNKWRKLKYNLRACSQQRGRVLLTFGGAYSNHLWATAAAGAAHDVPTLGVVRGESAYADNPTLRQARAWGMQLHFVGREEYRRRDDARYWETLRARFGDVYIVPEGGSNARALPGVAESVTELRAQLPNFDVLCCAVGSGGTLAGLAAALAPGEHALGFAVLRGAAYLVERVGEMAAGGRGTWSLNHEYHGGGYARVSPALFEFCETFATQTGISLDPLYTGKMMMGIYDLMARGTWPPGTTVVAMHTGGLQAWAGMAPSLARWRAGRR